MNKLARQRLRSITKHCFFAAIVCFLSCEFTSANSVVPPQHIALPNFSSSGEKQETEDDQDKSETASIWDSRPIELNAVYVQILDKVSGKIIVRRIEVGQPLEFGGIKVILRRCFKNAPEDCHEIYAYIEIFEKRLIFSRWLFASSPAINLFEHPLYDVRIEPYRS